MKSAGWLLLAAIILPALLAMYQQPRFVLSFADLITACF